MTELTKITGASSETAGPPIRAVIDIGSNSVRLVAFRGDQRTPMTLFNEKVMAGLGEGVADTGKMQKPNMEEGFAALDRFALLCRDMGTQRIEAFATAAVRVAKNGPKFVEEVKARCGIEVEVIDGRKEGYFSALGVAAGIPDADGIIGDLGGGSLELARLKKGEVSNVISLPIGALKLAEARAGGPDKIRKVIRKALADIEWADEEPGLPFYMVGGSWRALAHLQMHLMHFPLPIAHQYRLERDEIERLARSVPNLKPKRLGTIRQLSSQRIPHLPGAALLLRAVTKRLKSSHAIVSAYGIREGVFFEGLPEELAQEDPLIAAVRREGRKHARFAHHAEALERWTDTLFADDSAEQCRLRRAVCELSDIASSAHPDFRAERAMEVAVHGNWVNIDAAGRAQLGAALFALNGGPVTDPARAKLAPLTTFELLERATAWGLALRLGQGLTGGTVGPLRGSSVRRDGNELVLTFAEAYKALRSQSVEKRLNSLALRMGCGWRVEVAD